MVSQPPYTRRGVVYILSNPAMPGLLKVGCSGRSAAERARELSGATGVPAAFVVEWEWPVSDWKAVEALAHAKLGGLRSNQYREFFACSVPRARRAIRRASSAYLRPRWLRLLIGPRRCALASPRRYRQSSGGLTMLGVCSAWALLWWLALLRPVLPVWLPAPLLSVAATVERHAPN